MIGERHQFVFVLLFLIHAHHGDLINGSLISTDYCPPLQENWRCLTANGSESLRREMNQLMGTPDCPLVTNEMCVDTELYPVPCNCHAWYQCTQKNTNDELTACIYMCKPCSLIFNPHTQTCSYPETVPQSTCYDTPVAPPTTPPITTSPPSSTNPTTTSPASSTNPTTTSLPSSTNPTTTSPALSTNPTTTSPPSSTNPTTTSPPSSTASPTTTTPASSTNPTTTTPASSTVSPISTTNIPNITCEFEGNVFPYPGNCHMYFYCHETENGDFTVVTLNCGSMIFDPHQGSCTWKPNNSNICEDNERR